MFHPSVFKRELYFHWAKQRVFVFILQSHCAENWVVNVTTVCDEFALILINALFFSVKIICHYFTTIQYKVQEIITIIKLIIKYSA